MYFGSLILAWNDYKENFVGVPKEDLTVLMDDFFNNQGEDKNILRNNLFINKGSLIWLPPKKSTRYETKVAIINSHSDYKFYGGAIDSFKLFLSKNHFYEDKSKLGSLRSDVFKNSSTFEKLGVSEIELKNLVCASYISRIYDENSMFLNFAHKRV